MLTAKLAVKGWSMRTVEALVKSLSSTAQLAQKVIFMFRRFTEVIWFEYCHPRSSSNILRGTASRIPLFSSVISSGGPLDQKPTGLWSVTVYMANYFRHFAQGNLQLNLTWRSMFGSPFWACTIDAAVCVRPGRTFYTLCLLFPTFTPIRRCWNRSYTPLSAGNTGRVVWPLAAFICIQDERSHLRSPLRCFSVLVSGTWSARPLAPIWSAHS